MARDMQQFHNKKKKFGHGEKTASNPDNNGGRIGRLNEHTLGYYRRVSDTLKSGFETSEDKELMLTNVFTQLNEEALKVSQNQTVSTIVENLLREATEEQLTAFLLAFSADWEVACTDRFAAYVTQTLLHQIKPFIKDSTEEKSPKALFLELYSFLMGNLPVFMQDTYASHVVRVVTEILGGHQVSEKVIHSKAARGHQAVKGVQSKTAATYTPPDDFKEYLKSFSKRIFSMKRLKDYAENYLSNPVMQTVLLVLTKSSPSLCSKMCQLLIANTNMFEPGPNNSLPSMMTHEIGSHLVEQVFVVAPEALYTQLLDTHLANYYEDLALDSIGNYVLQTVIKHTRNETQFERIMEELTPHLENILAHNHMGIITKLAEACVMHRAKEQQLIKALMQAFHCHEPVERQLKLVPLLASLTTYEVFYKVKQLKKDNSDDSSDDSSSDEEEETPPQVAKLNDINLHGSLLLQKLLLFNNPRPIVNSLLDMRPVDIRFMACHKSGTHILEALLTGTTVGEKHKERLYTKLQGLYLELACDRGGSRVIDAMWTQATLKQKEAIAKEIAQHENKLRGDRFGYFVWRNLAIGHYVRRYKDWKEMQSGSTKKRQLFQGIINVQDSATSSKKPKLDMETTDGKASRSLKLQETGDSGVTASSLEQAVTAKKTSKKKKTKKKKEKSDSSSEEPVVETQKKKKTKLRAISHQPKLEKKRSKKKKKKI